MFGITAKISSNQVLTTVALFLLTTSRSTTTRYVDVRKFECPFSLDIFGRDIETP